MNILQPIEGSTARWIRIIGLWRPWSAELRLWRWGIEIGIREHKKLVKFVKLLAVESGYKSFSDE